MPSLLKNLFTGIAGGASAPRGPAASAASAASEEAPVEARTAAPVRTLYVRSPALCGSPEELNTEVLLAHPVTRMPAVTLESAPAQPRENRVRIAQRLIDAYHAALADEHNSPLRRVGEDLWTSLLRRDLGDLMDPIDARDAVALADFLADFGSSYVWFGGITNGVDGYTKDQDPQRVALTYLDKLICLAESLGTLRFESPEDGPWGANLLADPSDVIAGIEQALGVDLTPPLGAIHTDGIRAGAGLYNYRHINAIYGAVRALRLAGRGASVCEVGGGLGLTALYGQRLGLGSHVLLDLPITCLLAGHYLLHSLGEDAVTLHGEQPGPGSRIRILPYWRILELPERSFALALNQDSMPEIAENLVLSYIEQFKRLATIGFLSINHECGHPRTVRDSVRKVGGYHEVYRSRCWVREGYVEEFFRFA